MGTKSRETIWRGRIMGAKMHAENAREDTIDQCINGGLGRLEVECNRCKTRASLPLNAIRRPHDTPLWKLEASLKCRSCRRGPWAPSVHMIKLTETQEITPYKWVHPSEER